MKSIEWEASRELKAEDLNSLIASAQNVLEKLVNCPPPREGWHIESDVLKDRVYVYIMKNERVIGKGFAYVRTNRENTDVEMAQCFSYAAHQAFKNAQWREEFADE